MSILIKFICLSLFVSFIAVTHRVKYTQFLSMSLFFSTCWLYVFYVIDKFLIGIFLLVLICIIVVIESLYRVLKEKRWTSAMILDIVSPQWAILIVAFGIVHYFTRFNIVKMIDELHLWAALPKALYFTHHFQSGADSLLLGYKDYIPGMPVILAFFEWLNSSFKDNVLYFGYCCYGNIAMLIATDRIKWKQWYLIPIIGIGIGFAPLMFYNTILNDSTIWFKSIHVDPILGILVGCGLYLIYDRFWEERLGTIQFTLLLCVIVLMKSSGIALALGLAIAVLIKNRQFIKENKKMRCIWTIIICPVLIWFSWNVAQSVYSISKSADFGIRNLGEFEYLKELLHIFWTETVVIFNNVNTGYPASLPLAVAFLFVVGGGIYLLQEDGIHKKNVLLVHVIWGVLTLVFLCGLIIIYSDTMRRGYVGAPSYPRYISTMLTALWIAMFLIAINSFKWQTLKKIGLLSKGYIIVVIFLCVLAFPHSPILGIMYPNKVYPEADHYADEIRSKVDDGEILLIVDNEYNSISSDLSLYLQRRMYYDLLDCDVRLYGSHYLRDNIVVDTKQIVLPEDERLINTNISYIAFVTVGKEGNKLSLVRVEADKVKPNVFLYIES